MEDNANYLKQIGKIVVRGVKLKRNGIEYVLINYYKLNENNNKKKNFNLKLALYEVKRLVHV